MKKKNQEYDVTQNPLYHDTWKLLRKYRDVVWSLELSVQQVRSKFQIEYGSSIEDFLESIYLAGADLSGSEIEHHARCIERSHKMLKLMEAALELLRAKHKNGESYYWIFFFSVKISIPLENTGVSSVFAASVWPFSLIFSLARRNEGNFFQAVPTTLSRSLAEVRLASLVAWA